MSSKIVRKTLEEAQGVPNAEIDFSDKSLVHMDDMTRLWTMRNITRLTLSNNKITEVPPAIANLENMEILNLFNNALIDVPQSLSGMSSVLEFLEASSSKRVPRSSSKRVPRSEFLEASSSKRVPRSEFLEASSLKRVP
jgi:Leucine-rich repeat (LRR) protein